ncbi:MAG: hypothetical protein UU87_C0001G0038 [Parcubacteria group bacterium GW2011_GWA2_42_11]|nr:MAG: hypothetical protein UU87_C0001G0038 [Parcubacteria group bacterium GW2011_GWA2_42_11]
MKINWEESLEEIKEKASPLEFVLEKYPCCPGFKTVRGEKGQILTCPGCGGKVWMPSVTSIWPPQAVNGEFAILLELLASKNVVVEVAPEGMVLETFAALLTS